MNRHPTDLVALVFGVAFAISGTIIVATQASSVDVGPAWGTAVVAIAVGAVILLATLVRSRHEPVEVPVSAAAGEPAEDVADG
jgi:hypothetical protein